jgi:antitoxin HicB
VRSTFLKEEGILGSARRDADVFQRAMEKDKISKVEMARRMNTSPAALDRLLDPRNASARLQNPDARCARSRTDLRIELV